MTGNPRSSEVAVMTRHSRTISCRLEAPILVFIACMGVRAGLACAPESPTIRVRSNGDPAITTLLHDATRRSATFRRLVETINGTDGLVYIEPGTCGPGFRACLLMSVTI